MNSNEPAKFASLSILTACSLAFLSPAFNAGSPASQPPRDGTNQSSQENQSSDDDESETNGWEIIGWDPIRQQIRSWIFDSNGGFGEATWATDGDDWLIRASNVLPDDSRSTAENVLRKVDDDKFTWESQNRTLNPSFNCRGGRCPSARFRVHRA